MLFTRNAKEQNKAFSLFASFRLILASGLNLTLMNQQDAASTYNTTQIVPRGYEILAISFWGMAPNNLESRYTKHFADPNYIQILIFPHCYNTILLRFFI